MRDRRGEIKTEGKREWKKKKKKRKKERESECVCRIGVVDIRTDGIHLSPPEVLMGRASLLVGRP